MDRFAIATLGTAGSFTGQAALKHFSGSSTPSALLSHTTIPALFDSLRAGRARRAVVPFENSTNGAVQPTLALLAAACEKGDGEAGGPALRAYGHVAVRVELVLAGRGRRWRERAARREARGEWRMWHGAGGDETGDPGAPHVAHVRALHTHPQAWTQCAAFLARHFGPGAGASSGDAPAVARHDEGSTTMAAQKAARDPTGVSAAVCSRMAARAAGLDVLAAAIQDEQDNETRFLVLGPRGDDDDIPAHFRPPLSAGDGGRRLRRALVVCKVPAEDPAARESADALEAAGHVVWDAERNWAYALTDRDEASLESDLDQFVAELTGMGVRAWPCGSWPIVTEAES